jgi:hypothetical protein
MNGVNQISDHQQSVAPAPSRGLPHTPRSAGVADLTVQGSAFRVQRLGFLSELNGWFFNIER